MSRRIAATFHLSKSERLARLYAQAMILLALQGLLLLGLYVREGFQTPPDQMPVGLQLDPLHSLIHLAFGIAGVYVGFWRPGWALPFVQFFAVFYLLLAALGTFTPFHFGMQLELNENALHWALGSLAAAIGFGPILLSRLSRR